MLVKPLCRSLVIIRRYKEKSVSTVFFSLLRHLNSCLGTVGTGSGNHRNPSVYKLHRLTDDVHMLLFGKGS